MRAAFLPRLEEYLRQAGMTRVLAESAEPAARSAVEALAGLPHFEQLWAGDLKLSLQIIAVASGERLPGVEVVRRAQLLHERAAALGNRIRAEVQVLQLALYDRQVPAEEREFVLEKGRVTPWWPLGRGRAATWLVALAEPALYAEPFRGWPQELSADQLRTLLG